METLRALDIGRARDEGLNAAREGTILGIWRPMLEHWGKRHDAGKLTVGDVVHYVGERRRARVVDGKPHPGARGQTVRREVQALVRALRVAKRDRMLTALPFDPDELPRIRSDTPLPAQRGKLWSAQQIELVLANLSKKAVAAGHRDRCRLVQLTGLRLEELHRLRPEWVVPTVGGPAPALLTIPAEAAKWGKARQVPLVPEALEIVTRCAPFRRAKPNKSLKLASKDAGLPGVLTPRDLRTWYLSQVGAIDPVAAQVVGGHTNIATTGLYLHTGQERATLAVVRALEGGR